jgi:hypothetical protein
MEEAAEKPGLAQNPTSPLRPHFTMYAAVLFNVHH